MKHYIPSEIIRQKRNGSPLNEQDLKYFFDGYLSGDVTDYQASALLMAIYFNPLNVSETATLTKLMHTSGTSLSIPEEIKKLCVDKHSTGGVGDKTSFIILPLLILEGCYVPMMAGRSLGHTGGTIDKMESIPGIQTRYSLEAAQKLLMKNNGFLIGQSTEIAPLDYKLYHLRDVTATVESEGLIVGSILSKKLAESIEHLIMDVKTGSGAFLSNFQQAKSFCNLFLKVAKVQGLNTTCFITDMNTPLGRNAGNTLELLEVISILSGTGPEDTIDLSLDTASKLVNMAMPQRSQSEIRKSMQAHLQNGKAYEVLKHLFYEQGADTTYLENPHKFARAKYQIPAINRDSSGFVHSIDVRKLGLDIIRLGGGRLNKDSKIDHSVGFTQLKHVGERIENGEPFFIIESNDKSIAEHIANTVQQTYTITPTAPLKANLIIEKLDHASL